jgi:hypothetical protein
MPRYFMPALAGVSLLFAGHTLAHHVEQARGRACYESVAGLVRPDISAALACGWDPVTEKTLPHQ